MIRIARTAHGRGGAADQPPPLTDRSVFVGSRRHGQVHRVIGSVARSMATVFVTGESGTGKELAALRCMPAPTARAAPSSR